MQNIKSDDMILKALAKSIIFIQKDGHVIYSKKCNKLISLD